MSISANKIKLVRIVLFLDWRNRKEWEAYLEKTTKSKESVTIGGGTISLEETKNGKTCHYTGHFPQYQFRDNSTAKLFGNYDLWRFIESCEIREKNGDLETALLDTYVVFSSEMKKEGGKAWIESVRRSRDSFTLTGENWPPWDGSLTMEYQNNHNGGRDGEKHYDCFRWFPLPYPDEMKEEINYETMETHFVFHHLRKNKEVVDKTTHANFHIKDFGNTRTQTIFRFRDSFTSRFFYERKTMIYIYYPVDMGYEFFERLKGEHRIENADETISMVHILSDWAGQIPPMESGPPHDVYTHKSQDETLNDIKNAIGRAQSAFEVEYAPKIIYVSYTKSDTANMHAEINYITLRDYVNGLPNGPLTSMNIDNICGCLNNMKMTGRGCCKWEIIK